MNRINVTKYIYHLQNPNNLHYIALWNIKIGEPLFIGVKENTKNVLTLHLINPDTFVLSLS